MDFLTGDPEKRIEEHLAGGFKGDAVFGKVVRVLVAVLLEDNTLVRKLNIHLQKIAWRIYNVNAPMARTKRA